MYKSCYDAGEDQQVLLYVLRAELDKMPSKIVNHNWAEWFKQAHIKFFGSIIESQPYPHKLSYLDRVTKNGEKATFMMKAGERILADYSVMSGWPTLHGMFVIKNELRRFFFVSRKYCNKCIVEHVTSHLCLNSTGSGGVRTKSAWASLIIQLNQYERRGNVRYGEKSLCT